MESKIYTKTELHNKFAELFEIIKYFEDFNTQAQKSGVHTKQTSESDSMLYIGYKVGLEENTKELKTSATAIKECVTQMYKIAETNGKVVTGKLK